MLFTAISAVMTISTVRFTRSCRRTITEKPFMASPNRVESRVHRSIGSGVAAVVDQENLLERGLTAVERLHREAGEGTQQRTHIAADLELQMVIISCRDLDTIDVAKGFDINMRLCEGHLYGSRREVP